MSLSVQVRGELASEDVEVLRLSALRGLFSAVIEDPVTFVNAPALAAERGVQADISTATESPNHRSVVDVRAVYSDGSVANVAGTLSGPQQVEKIVQINGRNFDLRAEGIVPDRQLHRPAGNARQDRHPARCRRHQHPRGTAQ